VTVLLLVEDDPLLGAGLQAAFQHARYEVDWVRDGGAALARARSREYAGIVLDVGLPTMSGLEVLRELRHAGLGVPVLILTARDATRDKVAGLEAGADDYVVKTADLEELIARMHALLRRAGRADLQLKVGDVVLDLSTRCVTLRGEPIAVSRREFDVLHALMAAAGRVLTRHQLEQALYGWNHQVDSNAVEVHVHKLRQKLGADALKTVRGVGYSMPKAAP